MAEIKSSVWRHKITSEKEFANLSSIKGLFQVIQWRWHRTKLGDGSVTN